MNRRSSELIAVLVPVCLFFAAWWLSVGIVRERYIPVCAIGGLGLGVVLDLFFSRWTARAYLMRLRRSCSFIFVSVVTYAVFMGVRVFLVTGAVAGLYMGEGCGTRGGRGGREINPAHGALRRGVIGCAAAFSAFLALREPCTGRSSSTCSI